MAISIKNFIRVYLIPGVLAGFLVGVLIKYLVIDPTNIDMILILVTLLYLLWLNRRRF